MKIIHVIPSFKLAGAETMCGTLCVALKQCGHTVTAVSFYTEHTPITERLEQAGIPIVFLDKKPGVDLSIYRKLYQLFRQENPDVVHTHIGAARYAFPVAIMCGVPVRIHTVHNIAQKEQTQSGKLINCVLFRHFNVIPVALSEEVQKTIQDVYGLSAQKIPVIYNGIDLSRCQVKDDYTGRKSFTILHIGRFMDVKNHALLLRSFARFAKRHPEARLQLLGDGELREKMEQFVAELGITKSVQFAGLQSDVYPWLHEADVFILPSKFEGMPMTLIEAMGTGLPIIASAVGGIPDMLTNEKNALLIDPTENSIVQSLEALYCDEEKRKRLGQKALQESIRFSAQTMAQKYTSIYKAFDREK